MSYTRAQIRHELLDRWPRLGFYATADSFSTTAVVDVSEFEHTGYQTNEFKDYYIYRPGTTGNDVVKRASTLVQSTGTLSQDSSNYSDTSTLAYEILGMPPDVINNAIATAQKNQYAYTHIALTRNNGASDMDMETSGVNYWDGTSGGSSASNATPTKATSANNVYSGTQSLLITLSAANGYVRSEKFRVNPSQQTVTGIILRADVGTATLALYDVTNGAYITTGNNVSYSGEQFAFLWRTDTMPSGCEEVNVEVRGTGASDLIYVDCVYGPWQQEAHRVPLASYITEAYKLRTIFPAAFNLSITSSAGQIYDAYSRYWTDTWRMPQDFTIENFHREVAANSLLFNYPKSVPMDTGQMLWLQLARRLSDVEPLTSESAVTNEDLEKEMAYVQHEVALAALEMLPTNAFWKQMVEETKVEEAIETLGRPPPAAVKPYGTRNLRI